MPFINPSNSQPCEVARKEGITRDCSAQGDATDGSHGWMELERGRREPPLRTRSNAVFRIIIIIVTVIILTNINIRNTSCRYLGEMRGVISAADRIASTKPKLEVMVKHARNRQFSRRLLSKPKPYSAVQGFHEPNGHGSEDRSFDCLV